MLGDGRDENKDKELTKHRRVEKGFVLFEGNKELKGWNSVNLKVHVTSVEQRGKEAPSFIDFDRTLSNPHISSKHAHGTVKTREQDGNALGAWNHHSIRVIQRQQDMNQVKLNVAVFHPSVILARKGRGGGRYPGFLAGPAEHQHLQQI